MLYYISFKNKGDKTFLVVTVGTTIFFDLFPTSTQVTSLHSAVSLVLNSCITVALIFIPIRNAKLQMTPAEELYYRL
jgi:hypothetical protein